ncbi:Peptide chain release factor 3 OS=Ureibacillus acetophenoni OX=614649 GN=prfC PE=3 SV=1 [Ureibacillus acetophenoni]
MQLDNYNLKCLKHRMKNEYNVEVQMQPIGSKIARWIENEDAVKESMSSSRSMFSKRSL